MHYFWTRPFRGRYYHVRAGQSTGLLKRTALCGYRPKRWGQQVFNVLASQQEHDRCIKCLAEVKK